jgi:type II secretory pathway component GspD/PulD (secretin)
MKKLILVIGISIFLVSLGTNLSLNAEEAINPAASLPPEGNKEILKSDLAEKQMRISLNLRNIDIIEALKFFTFKTGLNIVPTQKVAGRITLTVENAPVQDVFDIMLRSNSLAYDKKGDIYNVMTEEEYKQFYGKNFFDTRQVKIFRLKYAIPEQAFNLLAALKSEIGRLLVEPESGAVMFIDTPEKIQEAEHALEAIEQKNTVKVFNLKYAQAEDVAEQLKSQLDLKKVGTIQADKRTNQVIVQTLPERMGNIEELIASLDKKTKQVFIDVKIIKIKLSNQLDTGVQWEGIFSLARKAGLAYIGSYPFSAVQATNAAWQSRSQFLSSIGDDVGGYPSSGYTSSYSGGTKISPGQNLHIGVVSKKQDYDAVVNYLQTLGQSKIIASPSLAVVNNQEAKILIGEHRAYITTTTTTGTTTTTVSESVTYVDIGVKLSVTPTINEDGYITMKVKPEISSVTGNVITSSDNVIPIIDTNTAETTVLAKDGSTIILAGLGREEIISSSEGVPILSKIPILGLAFRNKTEYKEHIELVVMITPIIFEGDKFITAKEGEKIPPKPAKKFDVFRPETQYENPPTIFIPIKEQEMPAKSFKSYDLTGVRTGIPVEKSSAVIMPPVKGEFLDKGFKSYN